MLNPKVSGLLLLTVLAVGLVVLAIWWGSTEVSVPKVEIPDLRARGPDVAGLRRRAEAGDREAQLLLGGFYRSGEHVRQNATEAARWYKAAAEHGSLDAQYVLGQMYETGEGVRQSYARAAEWYRLAANLAGHANCQFALGQLYFHGRGVDHDYSQAIGWFRKAAENGHAAAQFMLGAMLEEGWGMKRDYVEAYVWYKLAQRKADEAMAVSAKFDPATGLKNLLAKMNRQQTSEAERRLAAMPASRPAR